jgi:hypothetical protein
VIDPEEKADEEDWANARLLAGSWELLAKLKSLIADIEAMRLPLQIDEFAGAEFDPFSFFGSFTNYYDDRKNTMVDSDVGVRVYWPNLAILLDEATELVRKLEGRLPMDERSAKPDPDFSEPGPIMKKGDVINEGPLAGFEVIDTYTRAEAIADGLLVDVSDTAREAGILFPVAVTRPVWEEYIEPSSHDREKWGQDLKGRLWDTVWMLRLAIRRMKQSEDCKMDPGRLIFEVFYRLHGHVRRIPLKALCGPGDDGSPVVTVMLPDED